jgi:hypothetical protein
MSKGSAKRCSVGTSCGSTCISKSDKCKRVFSRSVGKALESLGRKAPHVAEHVGINIAAWKTGKVLGSMVSSYLESKYGIPTEVSKVAAESVVQGLTATALSAKELKSVSRVANSLLSETAAAFLGKSAHQQAENALASAEMKEILKEALPILSGKVAGTSISLGGQKIPALAAKVLQRSGEDIGKLLRFINPASPSFSEEKLPLESLSEALGDIGLLTLLKVSDTLER